MGKVLIIKDADFSENGIQLGTSIDIAGNLTLRRGYNINGAAASGVANARLATEPNVDLSTYISQGYTRLVAKMKTPYDSFHNQCIRITNADGTRNVTPSASYTADMLSVQLDPELPYFRYSTRILTGTYNNETYNAGTFAEIKLIKY
jgi:hypothetical protein